MGRTNTHRVPPLSDTFVISLIVPSGATLICSNPFFCPDFSTELLQIVYFNWNSGVLAEVKRCYADNTLFVTD